MMAMRYLKLLFLLMTFTAFSEEIHFFSDLPQEELIPSLIDKMTDEELLGQVLMFSYDGDRVSPENLYWVRDKNLGGVKIFGWNARNLYNMVNTISTLQTHATESRLRIPLLIATDQEGGWVRHVKGNTSQTPGNLSLGATGNIHDSYETGRIIGEELRSLGINMNFAPTVDVYSNHKADVIGPRAFSSDPVETAMLSTAFYKGMDTTGVITTAKHFPGHGNADEDSHGTLPLIHGTVEDLFKVDLIPYEFLFKEDVPAVMMGHLGFPDITQNVEPASLSRYFVNDLLKEQMGFRGIVITDDLFMHGARLKGKTFAEECKQALMAGNDVLLVSKTATYHKQIWDRLLTDMKKEPELKNRIVEAVKRILRVKLKYLKGDNAVPLTPSVEAVNNLPAEGSEEFFMNQSARSVTVLKDKLVPFENKTGESVLLIGQFNNFMNIGREFYPDAKRVYISYNPFFNPKKEDIERVLNSVEYFDTVIFCMTNPSSMKILKELEDYKGRLIVFSLLTPVYLDEIPWVETALAVYGTGSDSIRAGFSVLYGSYEATGKLPVTMKTVP